MKLNATPRHYMPLPQNQSDDDESCPSKEEKVFKNSFVASEGLSKRSRPTGTSEVDPKNLPMSPLRRTMFIFSLVLCILFVTIFIFLVPCTIPQNLNNMFNLSYKWKKVIHNMSFTSTLGFVNIGPFKSRLIILGYENHEYGLIAIQESNGIECWRLPLHSLPLSLFCNKIDVNADGVNECLVIGNSGLLAAVDATKGISLWYLHNHSGLTVPDFINGPTIVADCDDDKIVDILISYNVGKSENSSYLALVSGATGQIIGYLVELLQCNGPATIHVIWEVHNDLYIVLHCKGKQHDNFWLVSAKDVCSAAMNETSKLLLTNIFRIHNLSRDIQFYKVTGSTYQFVIVLEGIRFLLLEKTPQMNLKIVWKKNWKNYKRIITDGQFVNATKELVITDCDFYPSKVAGVSLIDGKETWSWILLDNGTVLTATKLPNFFGDNDGLILKVLSSATLYDPLISSEDLFYNSSKEVKYQDSENKALQNNFKLLQETFILVNCGKIPVAKTINTEEVVTVCKADTNCYPNVYSSDSTVLVKAFDHHAAYEVLTVTSTASSRNNSEKMTIKCLYLQSNSLSRCSG